MVRNRVGWAFAMAGWCLLAAGASAADREVRLLRPGEIARDVMPLPRIADAVGEPEQRINLALDRIDDAARRTVQECRRGAQGQGTRQRLLSVPVTAPGFLSFHVIDYADCGGAPPAYTTLSIVYDLRSGAPVDWTKLLPPALTGEITRAKRSGGFELVTLSSARLHRLYLDGYRPDSGGARTDADDNACRRAVSRTQNGRPPRMIVWFRAGEGLAVQSDLPKAMHACADEVLLPIETLRSEGASADLLVALKASRPAQLR